LADRVNHRQLIVSGWCAPIKDELAAASGWEVVAGPVCVAELPLFMGEKWHPPPGLI
jgi:CO dehydrogenase/acetyl-CoA synthase gamma subunit (corrinoid Fe-S protein)